MIDWTFGSYSGAGLILGSGRDKRNQHTAFVDSGNARKGIDNDAQDVITSWFVINPEQIKSIDNLNPTNVPDIRYQLKDMTLKNNTAKYTPERLENILSRYGSKSSPYYSQAYVAHMSPDRVF